jgi:hypothetical protein
MEELIFHLSDFGLLGQYLVYSWLALHTNHIFRHSDLVEDLFEFRHPDVSDHLKFYIQ